MNHINITTCIVFVTMWVLEKLERHDSTVTYSLLDHSPYQQDNIETLSLREFERLAYYLHVFISQSAIN